MMGDPIDLTPFGPFVKGIGFLYWLLAAGALWLAIKSPDSRRNKLLAALSVTLLFGYLPASIGLREYQSRSRLNASMALFQEHCKTAGEKITRTVDDVAGVVWMKWREKYGNEDNFADQWKLNDPYGRDCGLEDCIGNLLRVTRGANLNPDGAKRHERNYQFVETVDPLDQKAYRYTGYMGHDWAQAEVDRYRKEKGLDLPSFSYRFKAERVPIDKMSARYGVTWDDISTREDREHWIAGSSLKVLDLQTNEVLGERIGYMIDRGQGSQAGGRSPWLSAQESGCPPFLDSEGKPTRIGMTIRFVQRVLQPLSLEQQ